MSKTGKYAKHQGKKAENKKIGIPPYAKDNPFKKAKEGTIFKVKKIDKTKEVRKKAEKEHWSWVFNYIDKYEGKKAELIEQDRNGDLCLNFEGKRVWFSHLVLEEIKK